MGEKLVTSAINLPTCEQILRILYMHKMLDVPLLFYVTVIIFS